MVSIGQPWMWVVFIIFILWWYLKGNVGDEIANQKAVEFLTGYAIEKSISIDNIFVFLMIFSTLKCLLNINGVYCCMVF